MNSTASPGRPLPFDRVLLGVCHLPEQAPACHVGRHAMLTAEAGVATVRINEFAGSIMKSRSDQHESLVFFQNDIRASFEFRFEDREVTLSGLRTPLIDSRDAGTTNALATTGRPQ